jgi:hypothetical protein
MVNDSLVKKLMNKAFEQVFIKQKEFHFVPMAYFVDFCPMSLAFLPTTALYRIILCKHPTGTTRLATMPTRVIINLWLT